MSETRRPGLLVQCRQHCHGNEWRESAGKEEGIKEEEITASHHGGGGGVMMGSADK